MVKILWESFQVEKETWEKESKMKGKFQELFLNPCKEI